MFIMNRDLPYLLFDAVIDSLCMFYPNDYMLLISYTISAIAFSYFYNKLWWRIIIPPPHS